MSLRARLGYLGAALLLIVVGLGAWFVVRSSAPRSVDQTVHDFFSAQRDGDCEGLVALITERSWSNDGRWTRNEFLEHCADAVRGYQPPPTDELVISVYDEQGHYLAEDEDPDRNGAHALVSVSIRSEPWQPYDDLASRGLVGTVVRDDDGEWAVETDDVVLRIGRLVHETVSGYLEAHHDGDCERLIGYLSEAAWSVEGEVDRREFLGRCADAADVWEGASDRPRLEVKDVDVRFPERGRFERGPDRGRVIFRGNDRATAAVRYHLDGSDLTAFIPMREPEQVLLVKDGLQWKLDNWGAALLLTERDGSEALPYGVIRDAPLAAVAYADLWALLPDEVPRTALTNDAAFESTCGAYTDKPRRRPDSSDDIQYQLAITREWNPCPEYETRLTLYQFADENEARRAARHLAGDEPVALSSVVTDVPGIPDEALTSGLSAVVAHERMVVRVPYFIVAGDLSDAARILVAQLERLEARDPARGTRTTPVTALINPTRRISSVDLGSAAAHRTVHRVGWFYEPVLGH